MFVESCYDLDRSGKDIVFRLEFRLADRHELGCHTNSSMVWRSGVVLFCMQQSLFCPRLLFASQMSSKERVTSLLGKLMKVEVLDGRVFIGNLDCVDQKMSILLSHCEEYRQVGGTDGVPTSEERRYVGFALILQQHIARAFSESA
jgi:small nuclear ribonucleoprotein (snRNP)-like protein